MTLSLKVANGEEIGMMTETETENMTGEDLHLDKAQRLIQTTSMAMLPDGAIERETETETVTAATLSTHRNLIVDTDPTTQDAVPAKIPIAGDHQPDHHQDTMTTAAEEMIGRLVVEATAITFPIKMIVETKTSMVDGTVTMIVDMVLLVGEASLLDMMNLIEGIVIGTVIKIGIDMATRREIDVGREVLLHGVITGRKILGRLWSLMHFQSFKRREPSSYGSKLATFWQREVAWVVDKEDGLLFFSHDLTNWRSLIPLIASHQYTLFSNHHKRQKVITIQLQHVFQRKAKNYLYSNQTAKSNNQHTNKTIK
jgi:hypothetical protein